MTSSVRGIRSLAAVLATSACVLLGCSSSPAAQPSATAAPSTPAPSTSASSTPAQSTPAGPSSAEVPSSPAEPESATDTAAPSSIGDESGSPTAPGSSESGSSASGSSASGGAAKIEVTGAICDFLEQKVPVTEMATLTGLQVDRTVEMGDTWCVYGASNPDDIVTVQYQEDAKSSFDLNGASGTPVDTTTLGVPMYANQDTNGVYFLDGTTQWEVRVGNVGNGADPALYAAAITVAQKLLAG